MGILPHMRAFRRSLAVVLTWALLWVLLMGCQQKDQKYETTIFAMDTAMTFTVYGDGLCRSGQEVIDRNTYLVYWLEDFFSVTKEDSDVRRINAANGGETEVSAPTAALLRETLALCELTGGSLDITAYPAVRAWGFTTGDYRVPNQTELNALAANIDYTQVAVTEAERDGKVTSTVTLPAGMELDLGAVAKGAAADDLHLFFKADGIASALLDLGQSTILAIGARPDGSPWRIGIQDPAGEGYLGVLELEDMAMGTSGGYQRYFEEDGVRYWHIIDPDTAATARSGLASVTVVSPSGLTCDGLSTALFVMGLEEGTAFWRTHPEQTFDVIFITDDGSVFITSGLEESFSLAQGYEDREVTVLS